MAACLFTFVDGFVQFHVCGWLSVWITVCMVACAYRIRIKSFHDSIIAHLLKISHSDPAVCAMFMQPYTKWSIHIVIHTCKNACADPLTQKYTPPSMHTSMCMATWMDVYVNQANSWTAPAKPKYVHEYHKKFFKFSISFIIYLCYCLASKSKNTKKKWQTSGQQCSNYTKICR